MKYNIFKGLLAGGLIIAMAGCSENSWNKEYLEGFDENNMGKNNSTTTAEYTLTEDDYKAIAKNADNVTMAENNGTASALKAVASNMSFSPEAPARTYLPAFMATPNFAYFYANVNSTVNITYQETSGLTDEYRALAAANSYTVSSANYIAAWGSETDYIEAFAPMTPAASKLPTILAAQYPGATEGQYAVVTYKESSENPIFGNVGGGDEPGDDVVDFSKLTKDDVISFKGQIAAISNFGPIIATKGGNGFVYDRNTKWTTEYAIGDQLDMEAKVENYYGALELINPTFTKTGNAAMVYPTPEAWSASNVAAFMNEVTAAKTGSPIPARYVTFTGKLTISGNYYNFYIDGESSKYIGLYQPTDAQKAGLTADNYYTVTGYVMTTGTKGINIIPTNIAAGSSSAPALVSRAAANTPATKSVTTVYQYDGSAWAVAKGVAALSAADYTAMGFDNNKLSDADIYLPLYLKNNYPYAVAGDQMYVVYNGSKVALLDFDGTAWTLNNDGLKTITTQWRKLKEGWVFVKTVGVAVFNLVDEITPNAKYLFVANGICATPLAATYNYGYLQPAAIKTDGTTIEMSNDECAFELVDNYGGITLPQGQFLIKDGYDRYLIMQGTYNSFNLTKTPVTDGAITASAVFTFEPIGDGTWKVSTVINTETKWIQYSTNYSSWGCYATSSGLEPAIYKLAE